MPRHFWTLLFWATVLFAAWRLGALEKVAPIARAGYDTITGRKTIDITGAAQRSTIRSNLDRGIKRYGKKYGREPKDLQVLVEAGYLWGSDLQDEWGRPLHAELQSGRLLVRAMGKDGRLGTEDDWTLEN